MKILVADDDPVTLHKVVYRLRQWGHEVISCTDGGSAWNMLEGGLIPNVVILDWMMPGINGPELCLKIRARKDCLYVYIVLLTNDLAGIETAIGQLDQALPQVTDARASIGARVNRLDTIKDTLDLLSVNTQELRSTVEDADFAKVASELASLQVTLEASMLTLTRQFETSLLNFIR